MNRVLHYRGKASHFFALCRWRFWVALHRAAEVWRQRHELRARLIGDEPIFRHVIVSQFPITTVYAVQISHGLFGWRDTGIIKATSRLGDIETTSFVFRGEVTDSLDVALERFNRFRDRDQIA